MNMGKEWNERLKIWMQEIQKELMSPLGEVACSGFTTTQMLSVDEALSHEFRPMPIGTPWGRKWEYGWFRTQIKLPDSARGNRIVFSPDVGGEMLIWANGSLAGSKDLEHSYITLTRSAAGGEQFDILIESYSGHGPRLENGGPYRPGSIPVPEPPEFQVKVGHTAYFIWNEDAYQLALDVYTLMRLLDTLEQKSLRAQKIAEGLRQFTYLVDFEVPAKERREGFLAARKVLAPLLACVNGSTAPVFTIFGQSHLDLAWKWPFEETKRKCARTLSSQLTLMNEYPEYRFMICQPPIMETIEAYYPELYSRLEKKLQNGQLMPEGAFYVEPDTNIPSGESLIRQLLFGKKWFFEKCGYDSKMAWLPDTFGFSAALPQIFLGCDVPYFGTQKLVRCHPECDPFPYNIFMWEGIDGSRVLAHLFRENNSGIDPFLLVKRWDEDRYQQENIDTFLFPFGYGDGGGGPTRDIYELARRVQNLEGAPKTKIDTPVSFFEDIQKRQMAPNRYVGEMYLQWHRGTYTSMAKLKKGNRRSEIALREAELWSVAARLNGKIKYPFSELTVLWKKVLFNQFHDILAGTSITRVNQEAEADFVQAETQALHLAKEARTSLISLNSGKNHTQGIVLFNSLSWSRSCLVPLPSGTLGAKDAGGRILPSQIMEGSSFVKADIPACGYTSIYPFTENPHDSLQPAKQSSCAYYENDTAVLENEYLRIRFNAVGQILEILDKETGFQLAEGLCNNFKLYKDVNMEYDAWELGSMYKSLPVDLERSAETEILFGEADANAGYLTAGIRITRKLNNSLMSQIITLEQGSRRVDFKTRIDWQEQHKLLKVEFPVRVHADEALHEIQFGYVKRPTHKSRRYDADRYEVPQHRYTALAEAGRGVAVLNDSKYGVSVEENSINLTLLKAPVIPDMYADKGMQEFTYSFYAYSGCFADSGVVQNGYELNIPVQFSPGYADTTSLFEIHPSHRYGAKNPIDFAYNNIILEAVKEAEDKSGDIVLRLYESQNTESSCILHTACEVTRVCETNMLETEHRLLSIDGDHDIKLHFNPFEIKTIRLQIKI